ncbi:hypothetical protein GCM10022243_22480 [Saccharothrix violaceirubra]|uniref:Uncharacterized protein YkwD n=1 Tax=Saccharothrix violaceirubra TaxID=413306 RepID=A0A7W7WV84_9PSEU|nr:CAP domain-containing protein [Saccharothrix violaceirubra]MBB4964816.1 uncharacterized protein YkwD [Saccharothrix violaceirubra]
MPRNHRVLPAVVLVGLALAGCAEADRATELTATATTTVRVVVTTTTTILTPTVAATEAPTPEAVVPTRPENEVVEEKVVELTNAERARVGCAPLVADDRLARAAREHSVDMAAKNYFEHHSKDGRSFVDRVKAAGYPAPGAENIAAGHKTPELVVKGWMDSPGHRANIVNCRLKAIGVGMARGGSYGIYWTQNFGW